MRNRVLISTFVTAAALASVAVAFEGVAPVHADGPNAGAPWIVTIGDSAISGEAGRWAGNSDVSPSYVDTGANAYFDNATGTAEAIPGCHRSKAAEVGIFGGINVNSLNLACSGARTYTQTSGDFKPGLDWYDDGTHRSQVVELDTFARTHDVKAVTVLIGANNFGFADIVQQCVTDWLTSPSWWKNYCNDDSSVTSNFTSGNVAAVRARIATAYQNVRTAMRNAGYADGSWTLMVQDYESPIPNGTAFRYSESGYTRQSTGGCGFWNADANWANATTDAGLTNVRTLDLASAFNGHRLCENTDNLVEANYSSWRAAGAVDKSEWIDQIRTVSTATSDYYIQESLHPNYWGELAVRSCLRRAWNGGTPRSGTCTASGTGLLNGEPRMSLN
jgi:hypothetical protein